MKPSNALRTNTVCSARLRHTVSFPPLSLPQDLFLSTLSSPPTLASILAQPLHLAVLGNCSARLDERLGMVGELCGMREKKREGKCVKGEKS